MTLSHYVIKKIKTAPLTLGSSSWNTAMGLADGNENKGDVDGHTCRPFGTRADFHHSSVK